MNRHKTATATATAPRLGTVVFCVSISRPIEATSSASRARAIGVQGATSSVTMERSIGVNDAPESGVTSLGRAPSRSTTRRDLGGDRSRRRLRSGGVCRSTKPPLSDPMRRRRGIRWSAGVGSDGARAWDPRRRWCGIRWSALCNVHRSDSSDIT